MRCIAFIFVQTNTFSRNTHRRQNNSGVLFLKATCLYRGVSDWTAKNYWLTNSGPTHLSDRCCLYLIRCHLMMENGWFLQNIFEQGFIAGSKWLSQRLRHLKAITVSLFFTISWGKFIFLVLFFSQLLRLEIETGTNPTIKMTTWEV